MEHHDCTLAYFKLINLGTKLFKLTYDAHFFQVLMYKCIFCKLLKMRRMELVNFRPKAYLRGKVQHVCTRVVQLLSSLADPSPFSTNPTNIASQFLMAYLHRPQLEFYILFSKHSMLGSGMSNPIDITTHSQPSFFPPLKTEHHFQVNLYLI